MLLEDFKLKLNRKICIETKIITHQHNGIGILQYILANSAIKRMYVDISNILFLFNARVMLREA